MDYSGLFLVSRKIPISGLFRVCLTENSNIWIIPDYSLCRGKYQYLDYSVCVSRKIPIYGLFRIIPCVAENTNIWIIPCVSHGKYQYMDYSGLFLVSRKIRISG